MKKDSHCKTSFCGAWYKCVSSFRVDRTTEILQLYFYFDFLAIS